MKYLHNPEFWIKGSLLGRGSFGEVRLYTHIKTQFNIAVKQVTFDPNDNNSTSHMAAVTNEIKHLTKFSHDRIVTFLGSLADKEESLLSVCLEFMAGGSLFKLLQDGPLSLGKTIQYTRQILEGVEYLHQERIIHRDIKGKNILIENSNKIKLADFGISKQIETLSQTRGASTSNAGTIRWMAPEIVTGQKYGLKVDIWSVGCTMVEMLTTGPPWNNLNDAQIIIEILKGSYPTYILPEQRHEVQEVLRQCFHTDPAKRPSTQELLTANLLKSPETCGVLR